MYRHDWLILDIPIAKPWLKDYPQDLDCCPLYYKDPQTPKQENTPIQNAHLKQTYIVLRLAPFTTSLFCPLSLSFIRNLFSPQKKRWRAAICKTEEEGSSRQARWNEGVGREQNKKNERMSREKQRSMEETKKEWLKERHSTEKKYREEKNGSTLTWAHSAGLLGWWLRILFASGGCKLTFEHFLLWQGEGW